MTKNYLMGVARASAYRRLADREFKTKLAEPNRISELLVKGIRILNDLIRSHGYNKSIVSESRKLILEINFHVMKENLVGSKTEHFKAFTAFVKDHQSELKDQFDANFQLASNQILSLSEDSKTEDQSSNIFSGHSGPSLNELILQGFTKVIVNYIPFVEGGFPHYVFAKDENDHDYFLPVNNFDNGNWARWVFLEKEVKLAIRYTESSKGTARRKATEIYRP